MRLRIAVVTALSTGALVAPFSSAPALAAGGGLTARLSIGAAAAEPDGPSEAPSVADNGDVAFATHATNLGATDSNADSDVWVRTAAGANVLVSGASGVTANAASDSPAISADGRYVAFRSDATDLGVTDTNAASDVYLLDRDPSADGLDGADRALTRVSTRNGGAQAGGDSDQPALAVTPGGLYVAFRSAATNVVTQDRNRVADVFVRKHGTTTVTRVSTPDGIGEANGPSGNPAVGGDASQVYVAFESLADNLAFPDDPNGATDVYLRTLLGTPHTELVSLSSDERPGNAASYQPSVTADGSVVAFASDATNLVASDTNGWTDVLLRDRGAGTTTSLTAGENSRSDQPAISADGRAVAFRSFSSIVTPPDTNGLRDVFLRDLVNGTVTRSSVSSAGAQSDGRSEAPAISAKGEFVAFQSTATNLAPDANGLLDVFSRRRDVLAPGLPALSSAHPKSTWTKDNTIPVSIAVTDSPTGYSSGLAGLNVRWDTSPTTVVAQPFKSTDPVTSVTGTVGTGVHYVHVRAVDNEGNWGPTAHLGPFWVDTTAPKLTGMKVNGSPATFTYPAPTTTVTLSWSATDAHSGLDTAGYKVYYRRAAYNRTTAGLESRVLWKTTTATSVTFAGAQGYTYYFTVERRDKVGNVATTADDAFRNGGVVDAVDDTSATQVLDSSWTTQASTAYYGGEAQRASAVSAYLQLKFSDADKIGFFATQCPTCGSVALVLNGTTLLTYDLKRDTTRHNVPYVRDLPSKASGYLQVRVTSSGKPVTISGIIVTRAG